MNTRSRGPTHLNERPAPEPESLLLNQPEPESIVESSPAQQDQPPLDGGIGQNDPPEFPGHENLAQGTDAFSTRSVEPDHNNTVEPMQRQREPEECFAPTEPNGGIELGIEVSEPDLVPSDSESFNLESLSPTEGNLDEQHHQQMEADIR